MWLWWLQFLIISGCGLVPRVLAISAAEQAKNDYQSQYDRFRSAYTDFQLKKTQYQDGPTFAREEELATSGKVMLTSRLDLWQAYLQAISLQITDNQGITTGERETLNGQIGTTLSDITNHKQTLTTLDKRSDLNTEAQMVNAKGVNWLTLSYQAVSTLKMGQLMYAHQQLLVFAKDLRTAASTQISDPSVKDARLQGIDEVVNGLNTNLQTIQAWQNPAQPSQTAYQPDQLYTKSLETMTPLYQSMQKDESLLIELSQNLEL